MSAAGRASDLRIVAAAGVVTVLVSAASFLVAPVDDTPAVEGSTYGSHPGSARAAYLALRRAGVPVERSFEPLAQLRAVPSATVLVLADPIAGPSDQDRRALRAFVTAGGIVLATGAVGASFLPDMPSEFSRPQGRGVAVSEARAAMPSPLTLRAPSVQVSRGPSLPPWSPYVPLYGDDRAPAALAADLGAGRAIWWASAAPVTNERLADPGHAELLVNAVVVGSRVVLWDEHYHGHTRSLWSYIAGTPLPLGLAQLGLVFVAGLLAFSRRRWPARRVEERPRTSPLEFIDGMGGLYERAGAAAGALRTVRTRVRRTLCSACGVASTTSDAAVSRLVAQRTSLDAGHVRRALERSDESRHPAPITPAVARELVAELQRIAARVTSGT